MIKGMKNCFNSISTKQMNTYLFVLIDIAKLRDLEKENDIIKTLKEKIPNNVIDYQCLTKVVRNIRETMFTKNNTDPVIPMSKIFSLSDYLDEFEEEHNNNSEHRTVLNPHRFMADVVSYKKILSVYENCEVNTITFFCSFSDKIL